MSKNGDRSTPKNCPYCGERVSKLPNHLPCSAVPPTEAPGA